MYFGYVRFEMFNRYLRGYVSLAFGYMIRKLGKKFRFEIKI